MKSKPVVGILLTIVLILSGSIVSAQDETGAVTAISLSDAAITIDGAGAAAANHIVTITAAGTYSLSGSVAEGQIIVNAQDAGLVRLVLDGVEISSASTPIYIQNAEAAALVLPDGTQSFISSSAAYASAEDALNAAIFSHADLTIDGNGSLTLDAPAVDGIASRASLTISGSPLITVNAGDDALQVQTVFTITDGELKLAAGGGVGSALADELSGKGIKAEEQIVIEGGNITIDAADDGIRSERDLVINSGALVISVVGKAIHASYNLEINGGSIHVLSSDEGLEGGFIVINDGQINITASDDGINVSEPDDIPAPYLYYLHINGGYVVVDAEGDGIDSNGSIEMTGGTVIVHGPTGSGDGALDYEGTFNITGGLLIAAGSAGMPAAPGQTSSQHSVLINFDSALEAGTLIHIQTGEGEAVLTFAPSKVFQSIVFSSPELAEGVTYDVYSGGSSDGVEADGLYTDGSYTPGERRVSFTIADMTTLVGNVRGMRRGRP